MTFLVNNTQKVIIYFLLELFKSRTQTVVQSFHFSSVTFPKQDNPPCIPLKIRVRPIRVFLLITLGTSVSVSCSKQGRPVISYHVQGGHESQSSIHANSNVWAFVICSVIGRCLLHVANYDLWFVFCNAAVCTVCFVAMEGQCAVNIQSAAFGVYV